MTPRISYRFQNIAPTKAEIRIRGIIGWTNKDQEGWFGTEEGQGGTVREFEQQLQALGNVQAIDLYISSEGGDVATGLAMYAMLERHPATITAYVDGYAYSIASVIIMAADQVKMPSNSMLMIHNASTYGMGDYRDFERTSEALKAHNKVIRETYAKKSKRDEKEFIGLMDATTYLDGETARSLGLVDELTDDVALSNLALSPQFRASADFAKMPQRFAALFDTPPPSKPQTPQNRPMHKLILALAACNGISIKADATEDEALAAIAAHKPQSPNVVLNLEDPETKSRFDAAVSAGITAALPAAVEAATADIKASLTAVENLVRNGPAAAAGAGAPVPTVPAGGPAGGTRDEKPTMTNAAFRALSHPERNAFMASGGKLID